jgi:hypothetical protein
VADNDTPCAVRYDEIINGQPEPMLSELPSRSPLHPHTPVEAPPLLRTLLASMVTVQHLFLAAYRLTVTILLSFYFPVPLVDFQTDFHWCSPLFPTPHYPNQNATCSRSNLLPVLPCRLDEAMVLDLYGRGESRWHRRRQMRLCEKSQY